jgi:uncharacterized delta-60 repeat protein
MKTYNLQSWRKRTAIGTILGGIALLMVGTSVYVGAVSGGLDGTFGTNGKVITNITTGDDFGYAMKLQTDGKIVVAGSANATDFAVARYNVNGSLDTTFDDDGIVVTDIAGGVDNGYAMAIQSDGKIIVAGSTASGENNDFAVVRYNTDGSLDTSFDTDGKVITDLSSSYDIARGVAIQSDGKIVVAGATVVPVTSLDFGVVRYDTNGALDSTFGNGGKFTANLADGDFPLSDSGNAVAIQSDGKIVVVGSSWFDPFTKFAMIRCNSNGTLDTSFGTGGRVTSLLGNGYDFATAVEVQNDGKILVAGGIGLPSRATLVRYTSSGALDGSFGAGGIANNPSGVVLNGVAYSLFLQDNGKILLGGSGSYGISGGDFTVARYNSSGQLEERAVTPIGPQGDTVYGIGLQTDGRIVAAGASQMPAVGNAFSVARYDLGNLHSPPRRFDFDGDGKTDLGVTRPSNGFWYLYNSVTGFYQVQYNQANDKMVPADYDGDGKTDIATFRDGNWRISTAGPEIHFGQVGDVPLPGDYDGDNRADLAVFRQGTWYVQQTRDGLIGFGFGISTDRPVPEDYDGDGKYDAAVYRDGVWYIRQSTAGFAAIAFGVSTDRPVPADYDGDDKADVAVYRGGTWYIMGSTSGFRAVQFGVATDIPVPGDYDGDRQADIAVFRDGWWYKLHSTTGGFVYQNFGITDDKPLASVYQPE